jgi:hypothetical protein
MKPGTSANGRGIVVLMLLGVLAGLAAAPPAQARMDIELPTAYGRVPDNIYAIRPPNIFTHNVGLLTLQITNIGIIGNPFIDDFSAGWKGGEYLYFSGLWIGAIGADSEPHDSTAFPLELRAQLDSRWTIYESFEGVKNGVRLGSLGPEAADDDSDGLVDEDFHNGYDDDGDGRIDEDFAAIGQQMFSCEYRDDTPEAIAQVSDHYPMSILVRQRSFQWSTGQINEFVGFDFEIVNVGDQRLKELYIGFFSDSDAGPKTTPRYWTDDLVGWARLDTTIIDNNKPSGCEEIPLSIEAAFMFDAPDNGSTITGGDVPGWFGSLFLGHTTDDAGVRAPQNVGLTTVAWFSSSGQNSDPQNDDERYQLLSRGTRPARQIEGRPDDYRYVIAAGPFATLNPGESLDFQTAFVIGDGPSGFAANAINAQRVFDGAFFDADVNALTGVGGKERCLQALEPGVPVIWDDPCDTLTTQVVYKYPTPPCNTPGTHYVDADCDPCTGIQGKEALVNWVGTTAPPPPGINTDPRLLANPAFSALTPGGDRQVVIMWDNASQLAKDPITDVSLFRGYRIWRVDNWQRPEGSIGPGSEEWMKIAEFRNDIGQPGVNSEGAVSLELPFPNGPTVRTVEAVGLTDDDPPRNIYPVGRYRFEDTLGIINGKLYFYAVTAFGLTTINNSITGETEIVELAGLPAAVEAEAVVPRWDAVEGTCDQVAVVPNPYRGGADWDLIPSERDPTGTKIAFRNLPATESTIRIYTLAGDLVKDEVVDGSDSNGTYFWNMITRNGQNIVSGVYLYSVQFDAYNRDGVQYDGGTCRGRFVVIR